MAIARRRPNPTGFGPNWYSDRELLVGLLNDALAKAAMAYRVGSKRDIQRIHAGHWQRAAGAARWFAFAYATDGGDGRMELVSHDKMRDCVRRGFTFWFNRPAFTWEVVANEKRGEAVKSDWPA